MDNFYLEGRLIKNMNDLKLHLGKMSTKEIAQWMHINYSTFRNNKEKKLQILSKFCDFETVYGGVMITKIYSDVYERQLLDDEKVFLHQIDVANEGLSSVAGMARKLRRDSNYYNKLSGSMVEKRMGKANRTMFGQYKDKDKMAQGDYGFRKWVYAIKIDDYNNYRSLTEEENNLLKHIVKSICGQEVQKIMESMLLEQAFKNSDMSKEEYLLKRERFDLDLFSDVLFQFKKETGLTVVRIQKYQLNGIKLKRVV